jgi:Skp family chaperone for outer membrane proteins
MRIKLLLTLFIALAAGSAAMAQTGGAGGGQGAKPAAGAPGGQVPKMKVAIIDVLAFREQVTELKVKYDKLQAEFAPRYQQIESMQTKLAAQEKTLAENKSMTPQQAAKLNEDFTQGKREYERTLQDSQDLARKREQEETGAIYDKLSKFLDKYCVERGITHVFDARRLQETGLVVYASPTANITESFVKAYNQANPAPAAAAAKPN